MFRRLWDEHTEFLTKRLHIYCGAKSLIDLKTIVLDSFPMSTFMVFQPIKEQIDRYNKCHNKQSARGIKSAICNDSSSTSLELIQLVDFCRATVDRTTVSKVGFNNAGVKSFQTCHRQEGFSISQRANHPGGLGRNCLNLLYSNTKSI